MKKRLKKFRKSTFMQSKKRLSSNSKKISFRRKLMIFKVKLISMNKEFKSKLMRA